MCLQDQSGCFTHVDLFFLFQLIQIWVNLTKWLPFESGPWPICHRTSFLCFYHAVESREENKDTVGWWSIIWSDSHHEVWAFWNDAPSVYFLLFFILLSFLCVFFLLSISAFCLCFHLLSSLYSNKIQLLPFCQSLGAGSSFGGLCFMCFAWSFIGKRFFYVFDLLEQGITWGGFCSVSIFSFLKKFALLTNILFQLNFNITNVFSLAKQNLFYTICYITFGIVPFWPWERRGCVVGATPAGVRYGWAKVQSPQTCLLVDLPLLTDTNTHPFAFMFVPQGENWS